MPATPEREHLSDALPAVASTALRVAFGIVWVVDAVLTFSPEFASHYVGYLHNAAHGQAAWSGWWFDMWIAIVTPHATLFIWLTRVAESALALALIFGFARKTVYVLGALFSLLIWSTAEGFGGPYALGATNMGAAIAYVLIFVALIVINYRAGTSPYSVDYLIEKRWPAWRRVSEWAKDQGRPDVPHRISWRLQVGALVGVALLVFFLVAGLQSSLHVTAPSPAAAAAAVSPLSLASSQPLAQARDATLPPLTPGPVAKVTLTVTDRDVEIASGVRYTAWTYNKTVPGPIIHVLQGQTVEVTLINHGTMDHSIDFHAAQVAPNEDFVDIPPGKSLHFSFVAEVPGAFIYHCETAPILLHMGNGMYGALIVSPKKPLPPAAESYVLVQSEWYTQQLSGKLMTANYPRMLAKRPDEVVFNGMAFQYDDHPLPVTAGQRVRIYFVDAGPDDWTSFHVIGSMFEDVYPGGDLSQPIHDVSAYSVGPGAGAIFDLTIPKPGTYAFVDHDFANLMIGAKGEFVVHAPGATLPKASQPAAFSTDPDPATPAASSAAGPTAPAAAAPTPAASSQAASAAAPAATAVAAAPTGPYHFDPAQGTALYAANCAACHQVTGMGVTGAFPPLKGNPAVLDPDPAQQIDTILHGLHGKAIGGAAYAGVMPPFGDKLNDSEIANIVNHERSSWGNQAKQVTPQQVAKLRAAGK
ncbi:MAG TPA: multicopper oxidase domain-containing protein [Nevskiaceae bacterium]